MTDRCSGQHTLNKLARDGQLSQDALEKGVFFSRFETQCCFQVASLISAQESLAKPASRQMCSNMSPSTKTFAEDSL